MHVLLFLLPLVFAEEPLRFDQTYHHATRFADEFPNTDPEKSTFTVATEHSLVDLELDKEETIQDTHLTETYARNGEDDLEKALLGAEASKVLELVKKDVAELYYDQNLREKSLQRLDRLPLNDLDSIRAPLQIMLYKVGAEHNAAYQRAILMQKHMVLLDKNRNAYRHNEHLHHIPENTKKTKDQLMDELSQEIRTSWSILLQLNEEQSLDKVSILEEFAIYVGHNCGIADFLRFDEYGKKGLRLGRVVPGSMKDPTSILKRLELLQGNLRSYLKRAEEFSPSKLYETLEQNTSILRRNRNIDRR